MKLFSSSLAFSLLGVCGNNILVSAQDKNLADVAIENGFATLVTAANSSGLLDVLATLTTSLTVFAPTDEAFAGLPAGALDHLLANRGDLSTVLGYHTVFGNVTSDALTDGLDLTTSIGQTVAVTKENSTIKVNGATLDPIDLFGSNGVIHGIDQVLVPPTYAFPANIVEQVLEATDLSILANAVVVAGLADDLLSDIFTVFAPTDAAFSSLFGGLLDYLLENPDALKKVLLYHVVQGQKLAADLANGAIGTVNGADISITVVNGTVSVNDATVLTADITALNGVIHTIDKVLLPPDLELPPNISQVLDANADLSVLVAASTLAGLPDTLDDTLILTVFAPVNDAFSELPVGAFDYLTSNVDDLLKVLQYHVAIGSFLSTDLFDGMTIETIEGGNITIGVNETVTANTATVLGADITALNGVIHKIDQVLLPPGYSLPPNIYETAVRTSGFSTLVAAIDAAGLREELAGGIFTVFAPSDTAFASLFGGVLDYLLKNPDELRKVLLYHVVEGQKLAADLEDNERIRTVNRERVSINIVNGTVFVNDATVEAADVIALNGVIHAIDKVLIPPDVDFPPIISEVLSDDKDLTVLVAAGMLANLENSLDDTLILTVFAPVNDAFSALPVGAFDYLTSNVDDLLKILQYHVGIGSFLSTDLSDGMTIETIEGSNLTIGVNSTVTVNVATVLEADSTALNGVIHKIDQVLLPPGYSLPPNIYETAVAAGGFSTLVAAIDAAGLADVLVDDIFTVFAPTDAAFASLPGGLLDYLLAERDALTEILLYHVVEGQKLAADLENNERIRTVNREHVLINIVNGTVSVNGATVVSADVIALNGVIHAIDKVLIPPNFDVPPGVLEVLADERDLSVLVDAVALTDLPDMVNSLILTIFAPVNDAFNALPVGAFEYLTSDIARLTLVLAYHAIPGYVLLSDLTDGMSILTLCNCNNTIGVNDGTVTVDTATVIESDLTALNGVIHKIDQVLLPPGISFPPNLYETAVQADGFNTLVAAIDATELADVLVNDFFTIFAPTDAAFAALPFGLLDYLLENPDKLANILLYHVIEGQKLAADLEDDERIRTVNRERILISIVNGTVFVNDATVVAADVTALNGVIHAIDKVLIPPDFRLPDLPDEPVSGVPSDMPSLIPSDMPSFSPTLAPSDPEPEYSFVVSNILDDEDWCLTVTNSDDDANLGFARCDYEDVSDNQLWKFNGQFISKLDESRCMKAGFGGMIMSGIEMKLGSCEDSLTTFTYDETNKNIRPTADETLCVTNRGNSPNTSDTIHVKGCIDRGDYYWDFVEVDSL